MSAPRTQPMTATYPPPWKSTSAAKASNFGAVAARVTALTPDPANPGEMTQVTIAKVFGGLQDDRRAAEELAAMIVEAVNSHESLKARIQALEAALRDFADWCNVERHKLGAVDGYDYRSGEEYGLRRAEIEITKRLQPKDGAK